MLARHQNALLLLTATILCGAATADPVLTTNHKPEVVLMTPATLANLTVEYEHVTDDFLLKGPLPRAAKLKSNRSMRHIDLALADNRDKILVCRTYPVTFLADYFSRALPPEAKVASNILIAHYNEAHFRHVRNTFLARCPNQRSNP